MHFYILLKILDEICICEYAACAHNVLAQVLATLKTNLFEPGATFIYLC